MRKLVILGAGGHAKMVIEAARSQGVYEPIYCLAQGDHLPDSILGVPVAAESADQLQAIERMQACAFVAVGSNRIRRTLSNKLTQSHIELATIVAATAWVSPSASLGPGSVIMPGAIIGASAIVGDGAIINTSASIDHDCQLGDYVHIAPGTHLAGNVLVGEGTFLGVGVSVIPERSIGSWSTIGAGAVVVRNVPDQQLWVGCPARFLKAA